MTNEQREHFYGIGSAYALANVPVHPASIENGRETNRVDREDSGYAFWLTQAFLDADREAGSEDDLRALMGDDFSPFNLEALRIKAVIAAMNPAGLSGAALRIRAEYAGEVVDVIRAAAAEMNRLRRTDEPSNPVTGLNKDRSPLDLVDSIRSVLDAKSAVLGLAAVDPDGTLAEDIRAAASFATSDQSPRGWLVVTGDIDALAGEREMRRVIDINRGIAEAYGVFHLGSTVQEVVAARAPRVFLHHATKIGETRPGSAEWEEAVLTCIRSVGEMGPSAAKVFRDPVRHAEVSDAIPAFLQAVNALHGLSRMEEMGKVLSENLSGHPKLLVDAEIAAIRQEVTAIDRASTEKSGSTLRAFKK